MVWRWTLDSHLVTPFLLFLGAGQVTDLTEPDFLDDEVRLLDPSG